MEHLPIITLLMTIAIKNKLTKTTNRQQFIREREFIIQILLKSISGLKLIAENGDTGFDRFQIISRLHQTSEQILRYSLWKQADIAVINEFCKMTKQILKGEQGISNDIIIETDRVIAILRTESYYI